MKLNGRWFPQIVDRDSGTLYPIYPPFPCSDFLSPAMAKPLGGGGGVHRNAWHLCVCPSVCACVRLPMAERVGRGTPCLL